MEPTRVDAEDAEEPPCRCATDPQPPVVLVAGLAHVPDVFYCAACRSPVEVDSLGLEDEYLASLRYWKCLFDSLYFLWLDSQEFEAFAASAFASPEARVHRLGMELAAEGSRARRAYYAWFSTTADGTEGIEDYAACPHCSGALTAAWEWRVCARCNIAVPAPSPRAPA
jgi:hypothetical protein